jgi:ribosomal protein S18 acetylase RimI-like enzyme
VSDGFPIVISDAVRPADRQELEDRLNAFNMERTGYRDGRDLSCFVRDGDGRLVAGIDGYTWGGFLYVASLWVDETQRGRGVGCKLLEAAEEEAAARGCVTSVLSSFEFQAPEFYERLGYEIVGKTEDTPRGFRELLYQKRLDRRGR